MKHLILALVIALLSTPAATTAWSQQTTPPAWSQQPTEPTEQAIKDFIVNTMGNCDVDNVQFNGSTFHLQDDDWKVLIPVHRLYKAEAMYENLTFMCRRTEDASNNDCISDEDNWNSNNYSEVRTNACQPRHNVVLEQAFKHLIRIYDAKRFISNYDNN